MRTDTQHAREDTIYIAEIWWLGKPFGLSLVSIKWRQIGECWVETRGAYLLHFYRIVWAISKPIVPNVCSLNSVSCLHTMCAVLWNPKALGVEFLGVYLLPLSSKIIGFWIGKFKVFRKEHRIFIFFVYIIRFNFHVCFSLFSSTIIFYLIYTF